MRLDGAQPAVRHGMGRERCGGELRVGAKASAGRQAWYGPGQCGGVKEGRQARTPAVRHGMSRGAL